MLRDFGPIYGDLNNIAHVSRHDLAQQLVTIEQEDICAPSLVPKYNHELARSLYGNHVYFIIEITRQNARIFREILGEGLTEEEEKWIICASVILLRNKVIKPSPEDERRFPNMDLEEFVKKLV